MIKIDRNMSELWQVVLKYNLNIGAFIGYIVWTLLQAFTSQICRKIEFMFGVKIRECNGAV